MSEIKKSPLENMKDINSMIEKLANSNDIQSYKNQIIKWIEDNNKRILVSFEKDKKTYLLLKRTYYLNIFDIIEKQINNDEVFNKNNRLTNDKYLQLLSYFIVLVKFEELYINKVDAFKSLQLQSKILNMLKMYIINETN